MLPLTVDTHSITAGVLILIGTFVVMTPVIHFIIAGWAAKRKDIMDGFDANARLEYFKMFGRSFTCTTPEAAVAEFLHFHSRWYGRLSGRGTNLGALTRPRNNSGRR
jgi:hypothetical protein